MSTLPSFEGCEAVEKIHAGPIADLYRCRQQPLGRPVLIKALGSSILPSSPFAATLEREARVLAALDHPSIVAIHDFVRREDRMWLVLEHVQGHALDEIIGRSKRLPVSAAIAIVRAVARALAHAHERKIVHRDVQPRNVVVADGGSVKLTNFSVASEERLPTAPELLDGGSNLSSLAYQSPEQILGEPPDPRSDLFSLGAVLFELVTGEPPFGARNDPSVAQRIRNDPLPPLARFGEHSAGLERVIQRCLQKLPIDRFQNATELDEALAELAECPSDERKAVQSALSAAGFSKAETAPAPRKAGAKTFALWQVSAFFGIALLALVAGFSGIRLSAARSDKGAATKAGQGKLELVPQPAGYLRVVAQPWAHVHVDGELVDTTPFARPIPLAPGLHYVRLSHPQAVDERRTISLSSGETVVLDVSMKVPSSALAPTSAPSLLPAAAPVDSSP
jgi:eukaryotic-like serine/threonine-protein kinase